jgi:ABC-type branched-subunit amino acid transport system substrate-binding protein
VSKRYVALAVTVAFMVLGLTACGGGSSSSSSTSGGSTSSSEPGGEPIKLMVAGPTEAPEFSLPSLPIGAEVAAEEINEEGGINGRPVEITVCNDENNPNVAAGCARQAVSEDFVALVGGLSVFDLKMIPSLEQAGIPWIGLTTPDAFSQKNLYLLNTDGASPFTGAGTALVEKGCKKVAIITSGTAAAEINTAQIEAGAVSAGGTVVSTAQAPSNGGDWAPTVAAARSAGAECVAAGTGPAETGPLLSALAAGSPLPFAIAEGGLPEVVLKEVGAAADPVLGIGQFLPASSKEGIVQELGKKVAAKNPKIPYDGFAKSGYASVEVVKEAAKNVSGELTAETLTEALPTITDYNTGLGPVADFSKPSSVPGFERVFNVELFVNEVKNGEYVLTKDPGTIDPTPALEYLSKNK